MDVIDFGDAVPDDGADAEFLIARRLFGPASGADPVSVLRSARLPGCRYAIADAMLRNARLGPPTLEREGPLFEMLSRWMIRLDGERHRRIRSRFGSVLRADRVAALRLAVERRAQDLLDRLEPAGSMDLVADFARPLPLTTILDVLGVPAERQGMVDRELHELHRGFALQTNDPVAVDRAHAAAVALQDLMWELLCERAARPCDDLLSSLAAEMSNRRDEHADLVANCVFFIVAGHSTTTTLIAGGVVLLLENPEQLAMLREDVSLLPRAVEELLRLLSPTTTVPKCLRDGIARDDLWIRPGEVRRAFLAAANRDPDAFSDPDRLRIDRHEARHLAFGAGRHFCLGAPLARLNAEVALSALLCRYNGIRLTDKPAWRSAMPLRELEHVALAWET